MWLRVAALAGVAAVLSGCGSGSKVAVTTTTPGPTPTQTTETRGATTAGTLPSSPQRTSVVVEVGPKGVAGGPVHAKVTKGTKVLLIVRSALADEVHVHGYDLKSDVAKNGQTEIVFTASIPGRFEVELESRSLPIAELEVTAP
jgi:hypothetical protein